MGDGEEMKECGFAEWKFFDNIDERWRACGPFFAKLNQCGFNLRWI
jgi:hypothetical protein